MRVGRSGEWIRLEKVLEADPYFLELKRKEETAVTLRGRPLPKATASHHLWQAGTHRLWVRTEDAYGRVFHASRVIRVGSTRSQP